MEDPLGELDSPNDAPPYSMREIGTLYLELSMADTAMERKQILTGYGLSVEDAREIFRGLPGSIDPTAFDGLDADAS
ncbi:hypothetical protein ACWDTQ_17150 [Streptomyces cellulosae]